MCGTCSITDTSSDRIGPHEEASYDCQEYDERASAENILHCPVFLDVQVPEGYPEKYKQYDMNDLHSVYRSIWKWSVSVVMEKI